jgi:hypothetical protein
MPAHKEKLASGKYRVKTPEGTTAKSTTKEKADAQVNLLNAVAHGWKPTGKRKTGRHGDIDHIISDSGIGKSKMSTHHMGEHFCKGQNFARP